MIEACVAVAIAALAVQALVFWGPGRRRPIGDEHEYLARARADDPFAPVPFLRVPLFIAFGLLGRGVAEPTRAILALPAVASVLLTAAAAGFQLGPAGVLMVGLLFVLLPDRFVLSGHVWPDTLLALWQSALLFLAAAMSAGEAVSPWALGVVAALAVLTRIDSLAVLPVLLLDPAFHGETEGARTWLALAGPTVAILLLLTLWNGVRYGRPWPDDTVRFNLMVEAEEERSPGAPVERLVGGAWARWTGGDARATSPRIARRAWPMIVGAVRRMLGMLGPDTFARERLLGDASGAYPDLAPPWRVGLLAALRVSFPLLIALAIGGAAARPDLCGAPMRLAAAVFLAGSLVHARTRYRYALLPALSFCAGVGLLALGDVAEQAHVPWVMVAAAGLLLPLRGRAESVTEAA